MDQYQRYERSTNTWVDIYNCPIKEFRKKYPRCKTRQKPESEIKKQQAASVVELSDKGTQACIDHVERKIEIFKRVYPEKPNHQILSILKTIKVEFEQYL